MHITAHVQKYCRKCQERFAFIQHGTKCTYTALVLSHMKIHLIGVKPIDGDHEPQQVYPLLGPEIDILVLLQNLLK